MQPLAPQASFAAGQGPALTFAGNGLDGSSSPWRKEAGGATATGPVGQAAMPAAKPQAQFTTLLESLVSACEAGSAPVIKKDAPAVDKEDAPRVAFWMAAPAAAPQVSHPAKPADAGAETGDGALGDLSLTAERAATPDPSGDAAAALVKVTPQSGAPLPVAIATPMSDGPDAPEDRASRDRKGAEFRTTPLNFAQAAAPVTKNGAPVSKLAAAEAAAEQVTAGGTAADADATFRQTAGDRQDRNEAAAEQETAGSPAPGESAPDDPLRTKVGQMLSSVNPAISAVSSQLPTLGAPIGAGPSGRPVTEGLREGTIRRAQGPSGVAAKSQRVRDVMQAGTEVKLPRTAGARSVAKASPSAPQARSGGTKDRPGAAPEQEAVRGRSDGLRVSSTARMVPAQTQLPAAGLPAAERPAASPVLEEDRPPRPWREGRSPFPGATAKNRAPNAGTVGGRPLAAPAATGQTAAQSQPDANTEESGEEAAPAAAQPAANSVPAALEPPDDATKSSAARPMVVAFTARLSPVEAAPGVELPNRVAEPIEAGPVGDTAAATGATRRGEREDLHDIQAASNRQPDVSREPVRKPEVSAAGAPEPAVTARPATTPQPLAANDAQPRESAPDSPPPAAATEPAAAPVAPKPEAAHDIKLELAGQGDRRVEVRVSERAGDMHVEVRTPNTGLAGELREDLPALSTKLEQTGFRAETWHPAGTAERQRAAEAAPAAAAQNSERQPGQNGGQRQRDPQQQPKPKAQENETPSQNAGKDFAWLFSSIP